MTIHKKNIKVAELVEGYIDNGDGGVFGYNGRLAIRPPFQREFVYNDQQRKAVIETILKGYPLNVMYWTKTSWNKYEVLDGQQRTISIAQFINKDFPIKIDGNDKFFHNLSDEERERIENYELLVYVCSGTEDEKIAWFKTINIAGAVLTNQELLNATYTGAWLADAKVYFSKRNCVAGAMGDGYIKGNPIRQDYLEKVLSWIADRDNLESGQVYMALHQNDENANDLWLYYQRVMDWAKMLFPTKRKGITDTQDWGILYNKYHNNIYDISRLTAELQELLMDDDVTKKSGIIPYLLSERADYDEKHLSIRAFTETQKRKAYERQNHQCPYCLKAGIDTQYDFEDMQGDHIIPWSQGGRTTDDNLQMLCRKHNNLKSNN